MTKIAGAKRKFNLAGYRHQLLTPLNHIIGHAELMLDELQETGYSSVYQDLKRIRETARDLARGIKKGLAPRPGKSWEKVLGDVRYEMIAPLHTILQAVGAITSEYRDDLSLADVLQIGRSAAELLSFAQGKEIAVGEDSTQNVPGKPKQNPALRTGRILIVDDNHNSRQLLSRQLKRHGYEVTEAASGADALAVLVQSRQDLVLLDVLMPKLDGFQVLERIKADPALAEIPVIVLSALDEIPGVVRSIEIGAEDYLFKPFDTVLLSARLQSSLAKKRLHDLERKRAVELEQANLHLHASEERLRLALRVDQAYIWDWDFAANRIARYRPGGRDAAKEGTVEDILAELHPEDRERVRRRLSECVASREDFHEECRVLDPNGRIHWIAIIGTIEYGPNSKPVRMIGVARNITRHREAEAALRKSNEDFQRFAMAASHDLREPLRAVGADLESLLPADRPMDPETRKVIEAAVDRLGRMSKLIRDLLDYSEVSLKTGLLKPTSAEAVLTLVLNDLRRMIEESGAKITHDALPVVKGDFILLHRVFQNLITNSIKYRGAGDPKIHISAEHQGGNWKFAVKDNGVGIDGCHHDSIFGVFHRLNNHPVPGSGLGLAICRRILERLEGKIWVESEAGKGATFFFTVPAP